MLHSPLFYWQAKGKIKIKSRKVQNEYRTQELARRRTGQSADQCEASVKGDRRSFSFSRAAPTFGPFNQRPPACVFRVRCFHWIEFQCLQWCRPLVAQECGPLIKSASNTDKFEYQKKMEANETSANQTMSGQEDQYNWPFIIVFAFVVAGTVGNILVCLAVSLERPLQNVTNWFLVSLAFADLLVSTVVMPFGATAGFLGKNNVPQTRQSNNGYLAVKRSLKEWWLAAFKMTKFRIAIFEPPLRQIIKCGLDKKPTCSINDAKVAEWIQGSTVEFVT